MEYKKLGDICDVVSGGTPSRSKSQFWNGDIPWIKIGNIRGKYVSEADEFITEEGLSCSSAKMLKKGTILYTIFATLGEAAVLAVEACTNQAIAGITIKNEEIIDRDYLYYYLKSKRNYVNDIGRGVAQNNINMSILRGFEVPIREMFEQKTITDILNKIGRIIEARKEELNKLDKLIKARFVEMFGALNNTSYETLPLGDICEFIKDGTHQTPTYTEDKVRGYKFLSSKDVTSQKISWSNIKYIPESLHNELYSKLAPRRGDILLAKNGTTGVAAVVDTDEVFDIYVSLALLRPKVGYNSRYLWAVINSNDTKMQFNANLKGIGVPNLHLGEIKKAKVIVPPLEQQEKFAVFLEQIDKSKVVIQKSLEKAQQLFDKLMQDYFG
ncbi:MAG: restriction endonuclease subunit S [Succinivibrionaceae bacterium]